MITHARMMQGMAGFPVDVHGICGARVGGVAGADAIVVDTRADYDDLTCAVCRQVLRKQQPDWCATPAVTPSPAQTDDASALSDRVLVTGFQAFADAGFDIRFRRILRADGSVSDCAQAWSAVGGKCLTSVSCDANVGGGIQFARLIELLMQACTINGLWRYRSDQPYYGPG